jgi:hypothetical protein
MSKIMTANRKTIIFGIRLHSNGSAPVLHLILTRFQPGDQWPNLICQYHLRKRVGQTVERHFSKTRTHPLTQVVLTAPANPETVETVRRSKGQLWSPG